MQHLAAIHEGHAPFAPGYNYILNLESILGRACHFHNGIILIIADAASSLAHFLQIWSNKIAATILGPVRALGIDEHGNIIGMRLTNQPLTKIIGANALSVVGNDDAIQALIQQGC